jgi:hypothetical protein
MGGRLSISGVLLGKSKGSPVAAGHRGQHKAEQGIRQVIDGGHRSKAPAFNSRGLVKMCN